MFNSKAKAVNKPPKLKKSPVREWLDSVLFAVIAATLIRFLTFEAFAIPTPSMENSLMVGDFLFVSKLHYGIRTPKTPLQVPPHAPENLGYQYSFLQHSHSTAQLPASGVYDRKNGDVVVFNYPPPRVNEPDYPTDLKTNFIKRCIGIPGDVLTIRNERVYVNGHPFGAPIRAQTSYFIRTTEVLDERFFQKYDIINDFKSSEGPFINWQPLERYNDSTKTSTLVGYQVNTTKDIIAKFNDFDWVKGVEPMTEQAGQAASGIYGSAAYAWNRDNFGPLTVPGKGMTIPITKQTLAVYGPVIQRYEDNEHVDVTPTTVRINGQSVTSYTFKKDYYFMMGDNRHNSEDSRYWGFVPDDHIVGKAVFVWMSIDPVPADIWHKIRWNRLFRLIS